MHKNGWYRQQGFAFDRKADINFEKTNKKIFKVQLQFKHYLIHIHIRAHSHPKLLLKQISYSFK